MKDNWNKTANELCMSYAIDEAYKGISANEGGPFGCVIVKNGVIVGRGHNQVIKNNDPTAHGEMQAIRDACKTLRTFDLSGCEMYTTGQCCTMCLCASLWANIKHIYYACTIEDNAIIGFRDEKFDNIFNGRDKLNHYEECICHEQGIELFEVYKNKSDKINY